MDGVFMWKIFKLTVVILLVIGTINTYSLYRDKQTLNDEVIRLHVVADSDNPVAQELKLKVRDKILCLLDNIKSGAASKDEAMAMLKDQLSALQEAANEVLQQNGENCEAVVTLRKEAFPRREYDTFSLPAGVYDSLRITIGKGEGKNWWCVVFPDLCVPAASAEVEDVAVDAGFSNSLSKTLTGDGGYEIRFWILDCIGKLQNFLHMG
jgi:stage II sporulation protein R